MVLDVLFWLLLFSPGEYRISVILKGWRWKLRKSEPWKFTLDISHTELRMRLNNDYSFSDHICCMGTGRADESENYSQPRLGLFSSSLNDT